MSEIYLRGKNVYIKINDAEFSSLLNCRENKKNKFFLEGHIYSSKENVGKYKISYKNFSSHDGFIGGLLNVEPNTSLESAIVFFELNDKSIDKLERERKFNVYKDRYFYVSIDG